MPRAMIVATGYNLDDLPQEVQDISNVFNAGGWKVRLCIGRGATRAGLQAAAAEGQTKLVWLGCHSKAEGFVLDDGVLSPADLGTLLTKMRARECVFNACYSLDHTTQTQRAAPGVGIACTINPQGINDEVAWKVGVSLAARYVEKDDMGLAVKEATGNGIEQYRYIPARRRQVEGGRRMPENKIEEQLRQLLLAMYGDPKLTYVGALDRLGQMQAQLADMMDEQREWRGEIEREIMLIKGEIREPTMMTNRQAALVSSSFTLMAVLLIVLILRTGGFF